MLVKMMIQIPHTDVSTMMDLIKQSGGTIDQIAIADNGKKPIKRKARKPQVKVTRKMAREVLDFKKKHPAYKAKQIGYQFGISHASVGRILDGTAACLRKG